MTAIIPARRRSLVLRSNWTQTVAQTRKGLARLKKGIQRFASRRPIVAALIGLSALAALGAATARASR
jgi:hypothetical protein